MHMNTVTSPNPTMVQAGRKSWVTRKVNKLQAEYSNSTPGRKSWITKQINKIRAGK